MALFDYTWIEGGEQVLDEEDKRLADLALNEKRGNGRIHVFRPDSQDNDVEDVEIPF
jgi:hypothetical protein